MGFKNERETDNGKMHNRLEFDVNSFWENPFRRFDGGGGSSEDEYKPPAKPSLSAEGKYWEGVSYGAANRLLSGQGLLPAGVKAGNLRNELNSYEKSYADTKQFSGGLISRNVKSGDRRVKQFTDETLDRSYRTAVNETKKQYDYQDTQDKDLGTAMMTDLVSGSRRMGTSILSIYNQQQAQNYSTEQQYGTFNSNVAAGFGAGAGWVSAGQKYGQMMAGG